VALRVVRPLWDAWFRAREFKADEYAAKLGQADELAVALEHHALADDRPIPFRFLSGASHPSTEHRIQALNNYQPDQQPHAARHKLHQTPPMP
jgi:Zn-dependent protease with chaperone function